MTNAELAAEQIRKHGLDRYPTSQSQMLKLVEEVGELAEEINKGRMDRARCEAADVALALYNLAVKCDFDLDEAIREVVTQDKRKF
jgi:NTP pyrophosphatase (non-canonical NTP hydrolase)